VGPRTGLDDVEKRKFFMLPGLEFRPLARPARSQSLYRLSYPGSLIELHVETLMVRGPNLGGRILKLIIKEQVEDNN
jgi:hypothetical protein